jgi:Zn-dependent protease
MENAWRIGSVLGIPLRIHFSWLVIFALVSWSLAVGYFPTLFPDLPVWSYWLKGILAALLLFISIIVHELGHSVLARRHGIEISDITLFVFGGVSQLRSEPKTARSELLVAIVGPLISLALSLLFGLLAMALYREGRPSTAYAVFAYTAGLNMALFIFNLLPAFPLDGGRVLRAILWRIKGDFARATQLAVRVGQVLSIALILYGLFLVFMGRLGGLWLMFIGWFIFQAGTASSVQTAMQQALGRLHVRDVMATELKAVPADETVANLIDDYVVRYRYGGYPVRQDGSIVGLLDVNDVQSVPRQQREMTRVAEIMHPLAPELVVDPEAEVPKVLERMVSEHRGRLLVVDHGQVIGLITLNGILHTAQVRRSLAS